MLALVYIDVDHSEIRNLLVTTAWRQSKNMIKIRFLILNAQKVDYFKEEFLIHIRKFWVLDSGLPVFRTKDRDFFKKLWRAKQVHHQHTHNY